MRRLAKVNLLGYGRSKGLELTRTLDVQEPESSHVSDWENDEFSRGAYSYYRVHCSPFVFDKVCVVGGKVVGSCFDWFCV